MADEPIRILIVDDHAIVRQGLRMMLEAQPAVEIVGEAANIDEVWALLARLDAPPDLILLDLLMPGPDATQAIPRLATTANRPKILVLSSSLDDHLVRRALAAGADGYILKASRPADLWSAIEGVMRGLHALDPAINGAVLRQMRERDPLATLTPREREVFDGLARGQSNACIAVALVISEGTVRTHVVSILNKLGLRDRAAITIFALRRGLLTLDDLP